MKNAPTPSFCTFRATWKTTSTDNIAIIGKRVSLHSKALLEWYKTQARGDPESNFRQVRLRGAATVKHACRSDAGCVCLAKSQFKWKEVKTCTDYIC
eukprot:2243583-Amphidinium_carterae.1